ncbi:unnamed protein product [Acidithrix sp. C25]|nr:unnamed protein product [Acidithrix sp. C25]
MGKMSVASIAIVVSSASDKNDANWTRPAECRWSGYLG